MFAFGSVAPRVYMQLERGIEEEEGKKGGITYKGKRRRLYANRRFPSMYFLSSSFRVVFFLPFCPEAGNYKL